MGVLQVERSKAVKMARKLVKNSNLAMHIGSVAIAVEALEAILVEKGVIEPDTLMEKIKTLSEEHYAKGKFLPASED